MNSDMGSTPSASPVKLGQQHKLFMTKLQVSPTRNGVSEVNNVANSGSLSPLKNGDLSISSPERNVMNNNENTTNSSRVIDSLHEQVDTLTETNLELTKQSHNLLNKLENVQINETRLMEDLALLKNDNNVVNNELMNSTVRLKQLEEQLSELKLQYNEEINLKLSLEKQVQSFKRNENEQLQDEVMTRQSQYDTLLQSQQLYKEIYTKKINDMTEQLERIKSLYSGDMDEKNNNDTDESSILVTKLKEMEILSQEYDQMDKDLIKYIQEDKLKTLIDDQFEVEDWVQLFKSMNETFQEYVDKMGIPSNVVEKFRGELQAPNKVRLRHSSGNHDNKQKRRSYFGNMGSLSQEKEQSTGESDSNSNTFTTSNASRTPSDGATSMVLPGVKRSSSVRRTPSVNESVPSTPRSSKK